MFCVISSENKDTSRRARS